MSETSDDEGYLCPTIEQFIKTTRRPTRLTSKTDPRTRVKVTIWSLTSAACDHEYVYQCVVEIIHWVRSLRWSRYSLLDSWSYRIDLTPFRKRWNSDDKVLTTCQVNSGETHRPKPGIVNVRCIRQEDWLKVLIHETLHAHEWDRLVSDVWKNVDQQETLVESVARVLYCQWLCTSPLAPPILSNRETVKLETDWRRLLAIELVWMHQTCTQLRQSRWTATTHVESYYLRTTALLSNLDAFWSWLFPINAAKSSRDLSALWPPLMESSWYKCYNTRSNSIDLAQLVTRRRIDLHMVWHQVPVDVARPRLGVDEQLRRAKQGGPQVDTSIEDRQVYHGGRQLLPFDDDPIAWLERATLNLRASGQSSFKWLHTRRVLITCHLTRPRKTSRQYTTRPSRMHLISVVSGRGYMVINSTDRRQIKSGSLIMLPVVQSYRVVNSSLTRPVHWYSFDYREKEK